MDANEAAGRMNAETGRRVMSAMKSAQGADHRRQAEAVAEGMNQALLDQERRKGREAATAAGLLWCHKCNHRIEREHLSRLCSSVSEGNYTLEAMGANGGPVASDVVSASLDVRAIVQKVWCARPVGLSARRCDFRIPLYEGTVGDMWRAGTLMHPILRCPNNHYTLNPDPRDLQCAICRVSGRGEIPGQLPSVPPATNGLPSISSLATGGGARMGEAHLTHLGLTTEDHNTANAAAWGALQACLGQKFHSLPAPTQQKMRDWVLHLAVIERLQNRKREGLPDETRDAMQVRAEKWIVEHKADLAEIGNSLLSAHAPESHWETYPDGDKDDLLVLLKRLSFNRDVARMYSECPAGRSAAMIFFDIDHFKGVNDTLGHQAGDAVLIRVAEVIKEITGRRGRGYRYGGEELVVLLPDFSLDEAIAVAERVRVAVAAQTWPSYPGLAVTVSAGVAEKCAAHGKPDDLVHAADMAMYAAKDAGRNRVERAT